MRHQRRARWARMINESGRCRNFRLSQAKHEWSISRHNPEKRAPKRGKRKQRDNFPNRLPLSREASFAYDNGRRYGSPLS